MSSESALRQPPVKETSSGVWAPPDDWGVDSRSLVLLPMLGAPRDVSLLRGLFAWSLCAEAKAPPFCFGVSGRDVSRRAFSSRGSSHLTRGVGVVVVVVGGGEGGR